MHLPEELHPAPERSDPAAPIHFVDCFCGLGGAAQGARDAGLDVALGVDSNEKRLDVFSLNFPEAEGVCGQLAVPTSVFTDDMLRAKLPKGDFHIHFSPPCQELSVARGAKDDEAARDAQAVVAWCVNFASTCGALSWPLEEVNSADVFDALEALQKVDDNGHLNFLVRDVSFEHLGVPQSRRRFLAGSPWLIRRIAELERAPSFLSIADAFAATTRKDAGGAPLKIGGSHIRGHNPSVKNARGFKRADRGLRSVHDVCYTLTCRLSCFWAAKEYRGQDGKWHGEYKGTPETIRLRPFTLEEALIVQAFPDQFNIGRLRAVAREGIGNALPPPVMKQMLDFYQLSASSAPPPTKKRKA